MKSHGTISRIVSKVFAGLFAFSAINASAQLTASLGSTVVANPDRVVRFEQVPALPFYSNTQLSSYVEDGIQLAFDTIFPNTYATAVGPGSWSYQAFLDRNSGFDGTYAYFSHDGRTPYKPLFIKSSDQTPFAAMQLAIDTGYGGSTMYTHWQAYLRGAEIANGSFSFDRPGTVVGFSGALFDELRIGNFSSPFSTFDFQGSNGNAIFVDNIRADMAIAAVPEPETYVMLLAGLSMLAVIARRRRQS